jgi:hypothetical protein
MNKVLLVGDSHVFRLIEARKKHQTDKYKFDFVAGIGQIIKMFVIKDGYLKLKRPSKKWSKNEQLQSEKFQLWYQQCLEQVENVEQLSNYDAIIIFGCGLVDRTWYQFDPKKTYSSQFMADFLLERIEKKTHYKLLDELNESITNAKLFSIPTPLVNELIYSPEYKEKLKEVSDRTAPPDSSFKALLPLYKTVLKTVGSELLPLPDSLYNDEYNATSLSFKISSRDDFGHLNSAGAEIVFAAILENLESQIYD